MASAFNHTIFADISKVWNQLSQKSFMVLPIQLLRVCHLSFDFTFISLALQLKPSVFVMIALACVRIEAFCQWNSAFINEKKIQSHSHLSQVPNASELSLSYCTLPRHGCSTTCTRSRRLFWIFQSLTDRSHAVCVSSSSSTCGMRCIASNIPVKLKLLQTMRSSITALFWSSLSWYVLQAFDS